MGRVIYATANRQDVPQIARLLMESFAATIYRMYGCMPPRALFEHAVALARDVEPRALIVARSGRSVVGFVFAPHSLAAVRRVTLLRGYLLRWLWQWPLGWRRVGGSPLRLLLPYTESASPVPSRRPRDQGCILTVAVSPTARGQGIATRLVKHALSYLRHRHVRTVRVELPPHDGRALRLFLAVGFVPARGDVTGSDALIMLYENQDEAAERVPVGLRA